MASYWIVVPRGNTELYDLLSVAFRGRSDFSVIVDRRDAAQQPPEGERRAEGPEPGPDEFVVAERADSTYEAGRHADRAVSVRALRTPQRSGKRGSSRVRNCEPLSAGG
jgi:hypothetical protein